MRVLVGFGGGRAAIWILLAMVGVVEVAICLVKMGREEQNHQKNLSPHQWCSEPPRGNPAHLDPGQVKVR